jgi:phosphate/sulfate permease
MANSSFPTMKIIGIVLVVIGLGLAFWGYRLSGGVGSQISQAVTGSPTDKIMGFYIGGAVSLVVGLYLLIKK